MSEIERLILEKLDALSQVVYEVKEEVGLAREEASLAHKEARLAREEASLAHKEAVLAREEAKQAGERAKQAGDIALRTQMTLENEISRKIDAIGEGHDFLKMRLNDAMQLELKREQMELEIMNLRMEVKKIKMHFNIA